MQQAVVTRSVVSPVSGGGLHRSARTRNVVARAAAVAQDRFIPPWRDVYHELKSKGLRTIAPSEAADLLKTGDQGRPHSRSVIAEWCQPSLDLSVIRCNELYLWAACDRQRCGRS